MKFYKCEICQTPTDSFTERCEEHHRCDECETKDKLIFSSYGLLCRTCLDKSIQKQIDEFKDDTSHEDQVTCPYCGYKDIDSWEFTESGTYTCANCEHDFDLEVEIEVTYSTHKLDTKDSK